MKRWAIFRSQWVFYIFFAFWSLSAAGDDDGVGIAKFPEKYKIEDKGPPVFPLSDLESASKYMQMYVSEEFRGGAWWRDFAFNELQSAEWARLDPAKGFENQKYAQYAVKAQNDRVGGVFECLSGGPNLSSCYYNEPFRVVKAYSFGGAAYVDKTKLDVDASVKYHVVGHVDGVTPRTWTYRVSKPEYIVETYRLLHRDENNTTSGRAGWFFWKEKPRYISCEAIKRYFDAEIARLEESWKKSGDAVLEGVTLLRNRYVEGRNKIDEMCAQDASLADDAPDTSQEPGASPEGLSRHVASTNDTPCMSQVSALRSAMLNKDVDAIRLMVKFPVMANSGCGRVAIADSSASLSFYHSSDDELRRISLMSDAEFYRSVGVSSCDDHRVSLRLLGLERSAYDLSLPRSCIFPRSRLDDFVAKLLDIYEQRCIDCLEGLVRFPAWINVNGKETRLSNMKALRLYKDKVFSARLKKALLDASNNIEEKDHTHGFCMTAHCSYWIVHDIPSGRLQLDILAGEIWPDE